MAQPFDDAVAWITGGGSGIGRALAVELARRGAHVAVSGRRADRLEATVASIAELDRRGLAVACDVTDEAQVAEAIAHVVEAFGRLDVVVANAGFGVVGPIEELSADEWRRQLEVNVVALASTARLALPELRRTRGRLALVGSVASMAPVPGNGAYTASKFAVRAIGQVLAMELHGSGVSCTTLHPGLVESEIERVDNQGRFRPERPDPRPQRLMWSAERAARIMARAIQGRKRERVFTGHGRFLGFLARHAPGLFYLVTTRMVGVDKITANLKEA